jgi:type I restriction enzyme S subunit
VEKYEYLGNQESLQILNRGEILFSAEGTIGRFCVFVDIDKKTITNIHGITIFKKDDKDDVDRIFLGLFLAYLRKKNILDYLSVGGQGGSLAEKYWKYVKICNFPRPKRIEMAKYYYNPVSYEKQRLTINYFENEDVNVTHKAGIWQLDKQIKQITIKLNEIVNKIIDDKNIEVDFKFLLR